MPSLAPTFSSNNRTSGGWKDLFRLTFRSLDRDCRRLFSSVTFRPPANISFFLAFARVRVLPVVRRARVTPTEKNRFIDCGNERRGRTEQKTSSLHSAPTLLVLLLLRSILRECGWRVLSGSSSNSSKFQQLRAVGYPTRGRKGVVPERNVLHGNCDWKILEYSLEAYTNFGANVTRF